MPGARHRTVAPARGPGPLGIPDVFSRDLIASHLVLTGQPATPGRRVVAGPHLASRRVLVRRVAVAQVPGGGVAVPQVPGRGAAIPHYPGGRVLVRHVAVPHPVVPHVLAWRVPGPQVLGAPVSVFGTGFARCAVPARRGIPARRAVRARRVVRPPGVRNPVGGASGVGHAIRCVRAIRCVYAEQPGLVRRREVIRRPEFVGQPQLTKRLQVIGPPGLLSIPRRPGRGWAQVKRQLRLAQAEPGQPRSAAPGSR